MTIGQRIAQKRKEQGLSQENLGEMLGVSRQSVYKWESDAALPEIDKLIAMSRQFGVTVGWLLGVEEENFRQENSSQEPDGGELSEEQLKMVEEISDRYIAAQQPKKKRRWLKFLAVAAAIAVIWALSDLNRELDTLNRRYDNLQNSIGNISSNVNYQINGIADRVEEILESQNSLLAEYQVSIAGADLAKNTLHLSAGVTPKTFVDGMTAVFVVDTGDGPVEYPAQLQGDREFVSDIICSLTDRTNVSVVFITGDTRQTQIIYTRTGLYSATFPSVYPESHVLLMWKDVDANGDLTFRNEYVFLPYADRAVVSEDYVPEAEIREIKVGLFKNRKLVTWFEPCDQPNQFQGDFSAQQFYRVPDITLPVEEGDLFCVGALVIDEYDRERLYVEVPYALDGEGESLTWADDTMLDRVDKEDWYDQEKWSY